MLTEHHQKRLKEHQDRIESSRIPAKRDMVACMRYNCIDCIYDPTEPGSAKKQVLECSVQLCPIWPIREKLFS